MDIPPKGEIDELPTIPFGLFVPPSVEQLIGRRTLETEKEIVSGKRRSIKEMRPEIPADGGKALIPLDGVAEEEEETRARSSSAEGDYDAMTLSATTDGQSSRASTADYRSSKTSFLEEVANVVTGAGGRILSRSRGTLNEPSPEPEATSPGVAAAAAAAGGVQLEVQHSDQRARSPSRTSLSPTLPPVSPSKPLLSPTQPTLSPTANTPAQRTSPQTSEYDNVNGGSQVYEQDLDRTLEAMEAPAAGQSVTVITVNGYQGQQTKRSSEVHSASSVSYVRQESREVRREVRMQESTVVQANGPFFPTVHSPTRHSQSPTSPQQATSPVRVSPTRQATSPGHRSPGHRSPSQMSPGHRSPGQMSPGHRSPGQMSPGHRSSGHGSPGHTSPRQTTSPSRHGMVFPVAMSPTWQSTAHNPEVHSPTHNPGAAQSPTWHFPQQSPTRTVHVNGSSEHQLNGYPDLPLPPPPPPPPEGSLEIRMSPSRSPPPVGMSHSASDGQVVDGLPVGSPTRTGVVHSRSTGGIVQQVTTPTEDTRTIYRSSIYL